MENPQIQQELFQHIKGRLPVHLSLVDSVATVLNISSDSAYRRIRGDKSLDLQEAMLLCNHFNLSMDALFGGHGSRITFMSNHPAQGEQSFSEYLDGVARSVHYFHTFPEKKIYYDCKDVPLFHFFHSREIAAFKHFVWYKFLFRHQGMQTQRFSFDDFSDELWEKGRHIYHMYNTLPSVEFWNVESINSTIRQLDYLKDTGSFHSKADLIKVYEKMVELVDALEVMSANGEKPLILNNDADARPGSYEVYGNEVLLGGNTILAVLGASRMVFLNHSVFHYAYTSDQAFGLYIEQHMQNLSRTSTLLSKVSELERKAFFSAMRKAVLEKMNKV